MLSFEMLYPGLFMKHQIVDKALLMRFSVAENLALSSRSIRPTGSRMAKPKKQRQQTRRKQQKENKVDKGPKTAAAVPKAAQQQTPAAAQDGGSDGLEQLLRLTNLGHTYGLVICSPVNTHQRRAAVAAPLHYVFILHFAAGATSTRPSRCPVTSYSWTCMFIALLSVY